MALLKVENVKIRGISACVPKLVEDNASYPFFDGDALRNFVATTGIERRRKTAADMCSSDLCVSAAEILISELGWKKEDISFVVFVTQTPDYILPATSPIIQQRLGLGKDCYTLDISLGCSGWVYGMSVISALLSNVVGSSRVIWGLLMVGDTISKTVSLEDKSTYPLFGDAGTVTALEYLPGAEPMFFNMNSDGSGYDAIMINDGEYRNPFSVASLETVRREEGIISNNLQLMLDGMNVFSFGIREAPKSVGGLVEAFDINKDDVDYFTFHQANLFMNEQIRKKLKLPTEKVPYSLKNYGNTSNASIPLTMVTELRDVLREKKLQHIACGFGVGLSWGSMYFITDKIVCPELIEV